MQYGAMNFPIRPVLQEIAVISELGFDYLELTMDPPQAHYSVIRRQKERILKTLEDLNLGVICHLPTFVSTADLTEGLRKASLNEVLESLETASEIGAQKVVLHPSPISGMGVLMLRQARKYALESLGIIVEKAERLKLCLCLENMFPKSNSLVNPGEFVEVFEMFPALKFVFDTGHANIDDKDGNKIRAFIQRFQDRLEHVHASDNFGREDNHLPIGTGTIDFPAVMRMLREIPYDKTITLEVFSRDKDYLRISREKLVAMETQ